MAANVLSENLSLLLNRSLKALSTNRADLFEVRGFIVSHRSLLSSIFNIRHLQQQKLFWYFPPRRTSGRCVVACCSGPSEPASEELITPLARLRKGKSKSCRISTSGGPERISLEASGQTFPPGSFLTSGISIQGNSRTFERTVIMNHWSLASGQSGPAKQWSQLWRAASSAYKADVLNVVATLTLFTHTVFAPLCWRAASPRALWLYASCKMTAVVGLMLVHLFGVYCHK